VIQDNYNSASLQSRVFPFEGINFGTDPNLISMIVTAPAVWAGLPCAITIQSPTRATCTITTTVTPPVGSLWVRSERIDMPGSNRTHTLTCLQNVTSTLVSVTFKEELTSPLIESFYSSCIEQFR